MSKSDFRFHIPLTAWTKSGEENPLRIGGIVSTDDLDRQQETILQDGLDFSPFLTHGWFNDNHGQKTVDVLGYPTEARRVRKGDKLPNGDDSECNGWWAEGYLLDTDEGRRVYELCTALETSRGDRRLGFSIEGKVLQRDKRDKSRIVAAEVRNVAVTHCPVNTSTEMVALAKALSAGSAVSSGETTSGSGFALRAESLDGVEYDQNGRPKRKKSSKSKTLDLDPEMVYLTASSKEDGGEPNQGGVGGANAHLTKATIASDASSREVDTTGYVHHYADSVSDFLKEPVAMEMTKAEARIIVASIRPNLTTAEIDEIVSKAHQ